METEHYALRVLMNDDLFLTDQDRLWNGGSADDNLVEEGSVSEKTTPDFVFIGKNLKNFLIVTEEALQENHLKALENTLSRKGLVLDDIAAIDFSAHKNADIEQLNAVFMPQKLVSFGLKPADLHLPETEINQIIMHDNCRVLFTYGFAEMLGNKEKTKAFWTQMKDL